MAIRPMLGVAPGASAPILFFAATISVAPLAAGDEIFSSEFEYGEVGPGFPCDWSVVLTPEICNGYDDNCDFLTDNEPIPPDPAPICATQGICSGEIIPIACAGELGWKCSYASLGGDVELDANGDLLEDETRCDGLDGNCDGVVDDGVVPPPALCATLGACSGQTIPKVCAGGDGWRCNYTGVPDVEIGPDGELLEDETRCDSIDGNCDGVVDDGITEPPGSFCSNLGACAGKLFPRVCSDGAMRCVYGGTNIEVDGAGNLVENELVCNGLDGNCNGVADLDGFPLKGQACGSSGGHYICNPLQNGLVCSSP